MNYQAKCSSILTQTKLLYIRKDELLNVVETTKHGATKPRQTHKR